MILQAEADKQSAILHAEAVKEAKIREAEGEAQAILKIQQANADGIKFIREAGADSAVLQLKSLEAFAKAADGKATRSLFRQIFRALQVLPLLLRKLSKRQMPNNA